MRSKLLLLLGFLLSEKKWYFEGGGLWNSNFQNHQPIDTKQNHQEQQHKPDISLSLYIYKYRHSLSSLPFILTK